MAVTSELIEEIKESVYLGIKRRSYEIAVGTGTPSSSGLGNEIARKKVTEIIRVGDTIKVFTVFDEMEANDTLTEIALYDQNGNLLLYSEISPSITKDSSIKLMTGLEITISI